MKLCSFITLIAAVLLFGCAGFTQNNAELSECASITQAKQNIEILNGQEGSVCGYLKWEFENNNIFESKRDAKIYSNKCLSLSRPTALQNMSELNNKYVKITGVFTKEFCPEGTLCFASCSARKPSVRTNRLL